MKFPIIMSDKSKETKWQGFFRKAKYQQNKGEDDTWDDTIREALELGFLGKYYEAIDVVDEIIDNAYERLDKSYLEEAWHIKAHALEKLGKTDEALLAYDKCIKLDSKSQQFVHNKGVLLSELGRHSEALICFSKSVELSDDDDDERAASLASLAEAHLNMVTKNDLDLAMKYVDEAIKLDSENAFIYQVKAQILTDKSIEEYDKALECCEKGLKLDPEDDLEWSWLKGLIYLNMEKLDLAEKFCLEILNHDPSDSINHYNLACIYSLLKNKQKAIDHLIVVSYLNPTSFYEDIQNDESFDNIRDSEEFKRLQSPLS